MDLIMRIWEFSEHSYHYGIESFVNENLVVADIVLRQLESGYQTDLVGEMFTGLFDSRKAPIFEGDVIETEHKKRMLVIFEFGCFGCYDYQVVFFGEEPEKIFVPLNSYVVDGCTVIGSIRENPELLED